MKRNLIFASVACMALCLVILLFSTSANLIADVQNQNTSNSIVLPTTLKVIMIQFQDVKYDQYWDGSQWKFYAYIHKLSDFQAQLASLGTYYGTVDDEQVYGSFRDYLYENSRQTYSPTVQLLHTANAQGYPDWVTLPGNKSSYTINNIVSAANSAAQAAGKDISTSSTVKLCYIYAGNFYRNTIKVFATGLKGTTMVVHERLDIAASQIDQEAQGAKLNHIGYYAHEYIHLMGSDHTFTSNHWDVMDQGHRSGHRPASMNPWLLHKSGWANLNFINSDITNATVAYNTSPTTKSTFYIRKIIGPNECFLVENRWFSRTYDQLMPPTYLGLSGGILIWNIIGFGLNIRETDLIEADATSDESPNLGSDPREANDVFRPSVYVTNKIHDDSYPATMRLRSGAISKFAVTNYTSAGSTGNPSTTVSFKINYIPPIKPTLTSVSYVPGTQSHPEIPPQNYMLIKWNLNPETNISQYKTYRRVNSDGVDGWISVGLTGSTATQYKDYSIIINPPTTYFYKITAQNTNGYESGFSNTLSETSGIAKRSDREANPTAMPISLALFPNYPNPFNPETKIFYQLPEAKHVRLFIYNLLGEQIRVLENTEKPAGNHVAIWDGQNDRGTRVAAGAYLLRLEADNRFLTRKMLLLP